MDISKITIICASPVAPAETHHKLGSNLTYAILSEMEIDFNHYRDSFDHCKIKKSDKIDEAYHVVRSLF